VTSTVTAVASTGTRSRAVQASDTLGRYPIVPSASGSSVAASEYSPTSKTRGECHPVAAAGRGRDAGFVRRAGDPKPGPGRLLLRGVEEPQRDGAASPEAGAALASAHRHQVALASDGGEHAGQRERAVLLAHPVAERPLDTRDAAARDRGDRERAVRLDERALEEGRRAAERPRGGERDGEAQRATGDGDCPQDCDDLPHASPRGHCAPVGYRSASPSQAPSPPSTRAVIPHTASPSTA
jgi:hypothetical protein